MELTFILYVPNILKLTISSAKTFVYWYHKMFGLFLKGHIFR
jgi:hypothetical protein